MSKLTMMSGLPASGKSTRAKELISASGNTVRLNRDLLREMLHFDKWTPSNEKITMRVQRMLAKDLLEHDTNVIIDDTNLGKSHKGRWSSLAKECNAKFEVITMPCTDLDELVERDRNRERSVGEHVIKGMALQHRLYTPKKGWVLCDLDGTLADNRWRMHLIENSPKKWDEFFEKCLYDSLVSTTAKYLYKTISEGYEVVFITARPERNRYKTRFWIVDTFRDIRNEEHGYIESSPGTFFTILMRPDNDRSPASQVKKGLLDRYFPDKSMIHCVIEDDSSCIQMYMSNGLRVLHQKEL